MEQALEGSLGWSHRDGVFERCLDTDAILSNGRFWESTAKEKVQDLLRGLCVAMV
jgi:hypothetical protein